MYYFTVILYYFIKFNYLILKQQEHGMGTSTSIYSLLGRNKNETKI